MNIQIKHRYDGTVLFEGEFPSIKQAVEAAVKADAYLTGAYLARANLTRANLADADLTRANLAGANLADADLTGANLTRANLADADLAGANLADADLTGANLADADLTGANLADAYLTGANLARANLTGAYLTGADLTRADLTRANLAGANLADIKADLFLVLNLARHEVYGLLDTLRAGKIDGSTYEGACSCLCGTIATLKHCEYRAIPGLAPDASRPIERWFLAIRPGDTPENSQVAKITADWIEEWLNANPEVTG